MLTFSSSWKYTALCYLQHLGRPPRCQGQQISSQGGLGCPASRAWMPSQWWIHSLTPPDPRWKIQPKTLTYMQDKDIIRLKQHICQNGNTSSANATFDNISTIFDFFFFFFFTHKMGINYHVYTKVVMLHVHVCPHCCIHLYGIVNPVTYVDCL